MIRLLRTAHRLLTERPGYALLTASEERLGGLDPQRFAHAWIGLAGWSLLWGLAAAGLWSGAWWVFEDEYGVPVLSAGGVLVVGLLWPYRRAGAAVTAVLGGSDAGSRGVSAAVLVAVLALLLLGLKGRDLYLPRVPPAWAWAAPAPFLRVLILAPLWGAWAMMIVPQFCRPGPGTAPAVAAFARGCGPVTAAGAMGAVAAVTTLYMSYLPWWQLSISGGTIAAALLAGWLLCRRAGGLTRDALLAANLLTQIAFLLAYQANDP